MNRRRLLRNRLLPRPLHRVFNAVTPALLLATVLLYVWPSLMVSLGASLAIGAMLLLLGPDRFSFIEGVAGDLGYEDLDDPSGANR